MQVLEFDLGGRLGQGYAPALHQVDVIRHGHRALGVLFNQDDGAAAGEALGVESGATGLADVVRGAVSFGQAAW